MSKNSDDMVRVEIPKEMQKAIIRIQAAEDLEFVVACRRVAMLVDPRREEFQKAVQDEVNRLEKSRFMERVNKARKTIDDAAYKRGYDAGLMQFSYKCSLCGGTLYAQPNNEWKWILEKGYMSTWGHIQCQKKT